MRVFKTALTITAKGGLSVLFAFVLVLGVLTLDKNFNLVSKLTGSPQVAAVSSPALSNKFCDDPASESQTGCTSFIPEVLAATTTPYQDVRGNVLVSGSLGWNGGTSTLGGDQGGNIDLGNGTGMPYIDFYGPNTAGRDFNVRIINNANGVLSLTAQTVAASNKMVIGAANPVAPLTVTGQNWQGIRIDGGVSNRLTFVGSGNNNLWNIDNIDGIMRFFREDYSASGYGLNGVVRMSLSDKGYLNLNSDTTNNGWGGWNEVIRLNNGHHAAISFPAGGLLFGMHSDTSFYWANTRQGRYSMVLSNSGNLWIPGSLSQGSSKELKKEISALPPNEYKNILSKVNSTEVVNFKYKDEGDGTKKHIGVIAENAPDEITSDDKKSIRTADYLGFLLAAVKAQQTEIETLKREIEELKDK